MNKVELEAKVDALQDEINFLRAVFEAVRRYSYLFCSLPSFSKHSFCQHLEGNVQSFLKSLKK